MNSPGILGKTEASTTLKFSVPWTLKFPETTDLGSDSWPIEFEQDA